MDALPDAQAAAPGRALPARLFWVPVLVLDALLLALLPREVSVAVAVAAVAALFLIARTAPFALAVAAAGMPLLTPVAAASHDDRTLLLASILFLLLPGLVLVWNRLWEPDRGPRLGPAVRDPVSWMVVAIGVWLVCGLAWTPGPVYGALKAQMYFGVNVLLYAGAVVFLGRRREEGDAPGAARPGAPIPGAAVPGATRSRAGVPRAAVTVLRSFLWLEAAIAATAVWNWFTQYYVFRDDRLRTLAMNPIWTARHAGLGILVLLGLQAMGKLRLAVAVPLLGLLGWVFLRTGSRGPLVALAVTLGYWVVTAPRTRRSPGLTRALWVGAGVMVFAAALLVQRTAGLFAAGRRVSNLVRARLLEVSFDALSGVSLRGLGTGGFPSLFRLPDDRFYPHNIVIELLLENGVIGLALLGTFFFLVLRRWRRWGQVLRERGDLLTASSEAALRRTVGALLLFALANAQFSGDIWANEWVWVTAGMVVVWAPRNNR